MSRFFTNRIIDSKETLEKHLLHSKDKLIVIKKESLVNFWTIGKRIEREIEGSKIF